MKKISVLLFICFNIIGGDFLFSQPSGTKSISIGGTWLSGTDSYQLEMMDVNQNTLKLKVFENLNQINLSIGVRFENKKRFHALSLIDLGFQSNKESTITPIGQDGVSLPSIGRDNYMFNVSFSYEYGKRFVSSQQQRFIPALSVGLSPYFNYHRFIPFTSDFYPANIIDLGINLMIIPQLETKVGNSATIFLRPALNVLRFNILTKRLDTPYSDGHQVDRSSILQTKLGFNQISCGIFYFL